MIRQGVIQIVEGDCRTVLATMLAESVHCCVTSPPYWGLRDYGVAGQIGLEPTVDGYVSAMVGVFREVRRVLRSDGTLFLNLGDSYAGGGGIKPADGLKPKDLCGIPWRVAFALKSDGWYLRQDIIWAKPNPMPESVTDRCTKSHEYIFLLTKSARYFYDAEAVKEDCAPWNPKWGDPNKIPDCGSRGGAFIIDAPDGVSRIRSDQGSKNVHFRDRSAGRNKRSVWTVATEPFEEAHFAVMPTALIEPCILAGCPQDGTILDPFAGAGTTGLVADRLQRNAVLIELNSEYAEMARRRVVGDAPLLAWGQTVRVNDV